MGKHEYLVSVVIPTHNRSCYAIDAIKSILSIDSDLVEVVVHDTSNDDCLLKSWAEPIEDENFVYKYCSYRLSMTENHEKAVAMARGEYICLIGDDDSVLSNIVDVAKYAKERNIKLITPEIKASYSWPDFTTRILGDRHAGMLYLGKYTGEVKSKSCASALRFFLCNAGQGTEGMPKLYHGLVHKSVIQDLKCKAGAVFYGVSPDVSVSIGLALSQDNFYLIDCPFTLPGASKNSNTGRSANNKHKGDLDSDPHMKPFGDIIWPDCLPRYFSVETVWAHASWETLSVRAPYLLENFNLSRLYAISLFSNLDMARFTWSSIRLIRTDVMSMIFKVVFEYIRYAGIRVAAKTSRIMSLSVANGMDAYGPFEDVNEAQCHLNKIMSNGPFIKKIK